MENVQFAKILDLIHRLQSENTELKEETERLTKPIGKFKDQNALKKSYESLEKEFTRRSQQLKELKKRCEIAEETKNRLTIFDRVEIHDKAVKDTAKEIYFKVKHESGVELSFLNDLALWIKERFGIAVEKWVNVDSAEVE